MTSETSATSHVPFLQSDLQLDTSRVSESEDDWVRREGRTKLSQEKSDKTVYQQQVKGEKQKVMHTTIKRVDSI